MKITTIRTVLGTLGLSMVALAQEDWFKKWYACIREDKGRECSSLVPSNPPVLQPVRNDDEWFKKWYDCVHKEHRNDCGVLAPSETLPEDPDGRHSESSSSVADASSSSLSSASTESSSTVDNLNDGAVPDENGSEPSSDSGADWFKIWHDCTYKENRSDCSSLIPDSSIDSKPGEPEGGEADLGRSSSSASSCLAEENSCWFKEWHDCIYIHQRDDCSKLVPNSSFDSSSGVEGTDQGETSSSMTSSLASGENSWFKNWHDCVFEKARTDCDNLIPGHNSTSSSSGADENSSGISLIPDDGTMSGINLPVTDSGDESSTSASSTSSASSSSAATSASSSGSISGTDSAENRGSGSSTDSSHGSLPSEGADGNDSGKSETGSMIWHNRDDDDRDDDRGELQRPPVNVIWEPNPYKPQSATLTKAGNLRRARLE